MGAVTINSEVMAMSQQSVQVSTNLFKGLRCEECGNTELFVQVMASESHLVDGQLNYLRLLESETDRYECHECGEEIELEPDSDSE
jgi:DNA-directed RNA polymerase subunit RPC12/RpoP